MIGLCSFAAGVHVLTDLVLALNSLHVMHRFDVSVSVLCLAISEDQQFLFLGRSDGKLLVIGHEGSDKTR